MIQQRDICQLTFLMPNIPLYLETIKIEDGEIYNIEYHNQRFNRTRENLFGLSKHINLEEAIVSPPQEGLYRCRILYREKIIYVEYIPYIDKNPKSFKIVSSNIEYRYKSTYRDELNDLLKSSHLYDEIIIEKDGLLTDTTIANIAFYDGDSWITPEKPLLEGTMRAKLLDKKILIPKIIKSDNLRYFSHFALMNAMIGFQIQKNITIYDRKEGICL